MLRKGGYDVQIEFCALSLVFFSTEEGTVNVGGGRFHHNCGYFGDSATDSGSAPGSTTNPITHVRGTTFFQHPKLHVQYLRTDCQPRSPGQSPQSKKMSRSTGRHLPLGLIALRRLLPHDPLCCFLRRLPMRLAREAKRNHVEGNDCLHISCVKMFLSGVTCMALIICSLHVGGRWRCVGNVLREGG